MSLPRIRQLVFASHDLEDIERLKHILDLGDGFVDPGVTVFGLTNGVFALGDQFLEVVVPMQDNTAAGRFLDRSNGVGGYMVIFQTGDLSQVRAYADANNIRRVWDIDVEDISASHVHPADIGAAIVSVDEARPEGSWRWGGPDWRSQARPGQLSAIEIAAREPEALAARWANLLGLETRHVGHGVYEVDLAGGCVRVIPGARDCVTAYTLQHPEPHACLRRAEALGLIASKSSFHFAGVEVSLLPD
jgi:hypothetical protein